LPSVLALVPRSWDARYPRKDSSVRRRRLLLYVVNFRHSSYSPLTSACRNMKRYMALPHQRHQHRLLRENERTGWKRSVKRPNVPLTKHVGSHQVRRSMKADVEAWIQRGSVLRNLRQVTMMQCAAMGSPPESSTFALDAWSLRR
jgi:hypothetical protein